MPQFSYHSPEWKRVRRAALVRDGFKCTTCGACVRGKGQSRVDHIKPTKLFPVLALRLDNLHTLCASCDNKRHSEKGRGGIERIAAGIDGYPEGW